MEERGQCDAAGLVQYGTTTFTINSLLHLKVSNFCSRENTFVKNKKI